MMNMKSPLSVGATVTLLLFILFVIPVHAEIVPSGYVTASVYAEPSADKVLSSTGLRGAFNLEGSLFSAVQFRVSMEFFSNFAGLMEDTSYTSEWYYPLAYEGSWNARSFYTADLKEAWVSFPAGAFDITAGKQLVTWGQADGSNPTDNINARYIGTRSVSASPEKKLGSPMLNIVYNLPANSGTIQGVFMPVSVPNRMPSMGTFIREETPKLVIENMEGGVRVLVFPGTVSLSASYLTILDRYPSDAMETALMPVLPIIGPPQFFSVPSVLGHNRQHIFGLDAVYLVNGFDFRTEWAYTLTKDAAGTDPFEKNSFLSGVVQGTRSFFNGTTSCTISWAPQYIVNFEKPIVGQGFEFENMVGMRIQTKLLNETLQPEVLFLTALAARDYLATVGATYNIADGWNLKGGMNFYGSFRSSSDSDRALGTFGNDSMKDRDTVYLELRFDF